MNSLRMEEMKFHFSIFQLFHFSIFQLFHFSTFHFFHSSILILSRWYSTSIHRCLYRSLGSVSIRRIAFGLP